MANTTITRTPSGAGNKRTWTLSFWIKKQKNGDSSTFFINTDNSGAYGFYCQFTSSDQLKFGDYTTNGNWDVEFVTNRLFRDNNAWYHFVITYDTTQSTQSDRIRLYVNGVQETSFSTSTYPSQNYQGAWNGANQFYIGSYINTSNFLNGCMSHIHFIDGTSYNADTFGSTDATTGEWSIKTVPSVTYGTNGFFMFKDDNSLNDDSGNGNNFTLAGGTLTKTEDNPSNVFATFNNLTSWLGQNRTPTQVLANGNLKTGIGTSEKALLVSTIGVTSGKYYWEAKSDGVSKLFFGFSNRLVFDTSSDPHSQSGYNGVYYYEGTPDFRTYGSNTSTTGIASISTNDILGFALDMDNHAFYIHKNGTYMNSGSPTSGSSRTGSIAELFTYGRNCLSDYGEVFASAYVTSTSGSGTASFNFGNGYFGTTAVSSAGTNASNNGIFEYDVPTGYTALSTKGLNE